MAGAKLIFKTYASVSDPCLSFSVTGKEIAVPLKQSVDIWFDENYFVGSGAAEDYPLSFNAQVTTKLGKIPEAENNAANGLVTLNASGKIDGDKISLEKGSAPVYTNRYIIGDGTSTSVLELNDSANIAIGKIPEADNMTPYGIAILDGSGKIPSDNLPSTSISVDSTLTGAGTSVSPLGLSDQTKSKLLPANVISDKGKILIVDDEGFPAWSGDVQQGLKIVFASASATAVAGQHYVVTANGITLTLPQSPSDKAMIRVSLVGDVLGTIVVPSSGSTIEGDTQLVFDTKHSGALLVYNSSLTKWIVTDPTLVVGIPEIQIENYINGIVGTEA